MASELLHHQALRVVTNNLHVARTLSTNPRCEVIVAGGTVRHEDLGVVGEAALSFIRQFKVDIGLIGISGVDPDGTLRDFDMREDMVARAIVAQSRQVWRVAVRAPAVRHRCALPRGAGQDGCLGSSGALPAEG